MPLLGLLLTLTGWFEKVIGSGFDDHITGNDVDRLIHEWRSEQRGR